jgi:hypothetical protein
MLEGKSRSYCLVLLPLSFLWCDANHVRSLPPISISVPLTYLLPPHRDIRLSSLTITPHLHHILHTSRYYPLSFLVRRGPRHSLCRVGLPAAAKVPRVEPSFVAYCPHQLPTLTRLFVTEAYICYYLELIFSYPVVSIWCFFRVLTRH